MNQMTRSVLSVRGCAVLLAVFSLALAQGCGGGDDGSEMPTLSEWEVLIENIREAAREGEEKFAGVLASGVSIPEEEREKYGNNYYKLREADAGSDETTLNLTVKNPNDGSVLGDVTWTVVKEGDAWKLKDAPFPNAEAP